MPSGLGHPPAAHVAEDILETCIANPKASTNKWIKWYALGEDPNS
jgi:hypothetical protein